MFEVDVKNVTEGREEGKGRRRGDQLGFGVLITLLTINLGWYNICISSLFRLTS